MNETNKRTRRITDRPVIALRLPADLDAEVRARAEREGNQVTAVIRGLLRQALNQSEGAR